MFIAACYPIDHHQEPGAAACPREGLELPASLLRLLVDLRLPVVVGYRRIEPASQVGLGVLPLGVAGALGVLGALGPSGPLADSPFHEIVAPRLPRETYSRAPKSALRKGESRLLD